MRKTIEIQEIKTTCDGCGKLKVNPVAMVTSSVSGWRQIREIDLCPICYDLATLEIIKRTPQETIKKIIKNIPQYSGYSGYDTTLVGLQ